MPAIDDAVWEESQVVPQDAIIVNLMPNRQYPPDRDYVFGSLRRITNGESFLDVVCHDYLKRDATNQTVAAILRIGLDEAEGNIERLLAIFNIPTTKAEVFYGFLKTYFAKPPETQIH